MNSPESVGAIVAAEQRALRGSTVSRAIACQAVSRAAGRAAGLCGPDVGEVLGLLGRQDREIPDAPFDDDVVDHEFSFDGTPYEGLFELQYEISDPELRVFLDHVLQDVDLYTPPHIDRNVAHGLAAMYTSVLLATPGIGERGVWKNIGGTLRAHADLTEVQLHEEDLFIPKGISMQDLDRLDEASLGIVVALLHTAVFQRWRQILDVADLSRVSGSTRWWER